MEQDLREALVASTRRVFKTLLRVDIDVSARRAMAGDEAGADVTAEVDVWGDIEGSVIVSMGPSMARRMTAMISGVQPVEVDERALDVAGEIASMITEGALGLLDGVTFTASSPTIRLHEPQSRLVRNDPSAILLHCACECGEFMIDSHLRGQRTTAHATRHAAPAHVTGSY